MRRLIAAVVMLLSLLAAGSVAVAAVGGPRLAGRSGRPPAVQELVGELHLAQASCPNGRPSGSYAVITFGTRMVANHASACDHGAVTLLRPGRVALSTRSLTPVSYLGFGRSGQPLGGFTAPTRFGGHDATLVTANRDLQDGPSAPATFYPPRIYLVNGRLAGDVRSVQALYDGPAGASCAAASGQGCWLIGNEDATGTYNARTHHFTLDWFAGQAFTGPSAGMQFHLTGTFHGVLRRVPPGTTVDLGTRSFAAGRAESASYTATGSGRQNGSMKRRRGGGANAAGRMAAASVTGRSTSGSPMAFVVGELLVVANLLVLGVVGARRLTRGHS